MFDSCQTLAELNEKRLDQLKAGVTPIEVNKEFAKRKAEILMLREGGFKKVTFTELNLGNATEYVGVDFAWMDPDDQYTLVITTV